MAQAQKMLQRHSLSLRGLAFLLAGTFLLAVVATLAPWQTDAPAERKQPTPVAAAEKPELPVAQNSQVLESQDSVEVVAQYVIPIMEGNWTEITPQNMRVDTILTDPTDGYALYAIRYLWRGEPGEIRVSRDGGDSWELSGPAPSNVQTLDQGWREIGAQVIPQLERNPEFLQQIKGTLTVSSAAVSNLATDGNILFATILDMSGDSDDGKTPPVRSNIRLIVSLDDGSSWIERAPPGRLETQYDPPLAIGWEKQTVILYLVVNSLNGRELWKTVMQSPS